MEIWEYDKLVLFIAFVIPGFISIKFYQLLFPGVQRESTDQLIDAIAYSCINYAFLLLPIIAVEKSSIKENCCIIYYIFYLFVFIFAPVLWVIFWKFLRTRNFFQINAPHPISKPWDYVFGKRKPYWVKVTMKDGTVLAGRYGENSFTSSSPAEEQIYLEEKWVINENGAFERKVNNTAGIIIL